MEAGQLKRPICIQAPSTTQDAYGQEGTTYTDLLSTWASINAATSKEVYSAQGSGFTGSVTHKIVIRYNPCVAITSGMLVIYRGRKFNIQTVTDPDEERRQLVLMCVELSK